MVKEDSYIGIAASSEGLYKDRGSRFLAYAYPVSSEREVKPLVDALKAEHHGARHHCYAYRIGADGALSRSSDDGEPSGTAGRPILGAIDSAGLSDVLVVVVRYFGGIKLGIPGLIRAYKTSTADALEQAEKMEKVAGKDYLVEFPYLSMNAVMKVAKDLSLPQKNQSFGENCRMELRVRLSQDADFADRMLHIEGVTFKLI